MSSNATINLDSLKRPFAPSDIEWRLAECGDKNGKVWAKCLAYVTNRAIMDRLDEVVGPAGWKNEYQPGPSGGVVCGISVKVDGEWITKWDGAENPDIEPIKGGLSNAMKRAAVQWGIGRYLYDLEVAWADVREDGIHFGRTPKAKDGTPGKSFRWTPPRLPDWAVPGHAQRGADGPHEPPNGNDKAGDETAATSKALAAIANAPTEAAVNRYLKAVRERPEDFTAGEVKKLEHAAAKRLMELAEPAHAG